MMQTVHKGVPARALFLCTLAFMAALLWCVPAFADGVDVSATSPTNGATDVPVSGQMWVQFSHSVSSVAANKKHVTLLDADGKKVAASKCKVSMPDSETQFGLRQYILIKVKGLAYDSTYTIHISSGVTAKNGMTCDTNTDVTFSTVAKGAVAITLDKPTEVSGGSGSGGGTGSGSSADSTSSDDVETVYLGGTTDKGSTDTGYGLPPQAIVMLCVLLAIVIVAIVIYARRKKHLDER